MSVLKPAGYHQLQRVQVTEDLVKKYRMITPLLRKIEEAVIGTNTGKALLLLPYYAHWERAIFRSVNALALNSLHTLVRQLSTTGSEAANSSAPHPAAPPLFKVRVTFFALNALNASTQISSQLPL